MLLYLFVCFVICVLTFIKCEMADDCTVVRFSNESHSARIETLKTGDNGDKMSDYSAEFGVFYVICISLSIITYALDYILACWLLYYYSINGQGVYLALTLTFVVLPAILMTAFSMRWSVCFIINLTTIASGMNVCFTQVYR